jgi:hypothetical protein
LDFNENYKYSEFLYNSIPTIRKGIIYKNKKYFSSKINILPLHYPLESGTDDKSLKYFEQNFKHLKNHLKTSSHVVIATHPDLNKDLLIKLTSKINFDKYWMKPIIEVVERWEKTMEPGNLLMYNDKFGNLFLKSKFNISNLNFEVLDEKQSKSFDLNIKSFDVYNLEKKC